MIIIKAHGGLCNRMKSIRSAYALSLDLDTELTIIWEQVDYINCRFSDLFKSINNVKVIEINCSNYREQRKLMEIMRKSEIITSIGINRKGQNSVQIMGDDSLDINFFKSIKSRDIYIESYLDFYYRPNKRKELDIFKPKETIINNINKLVESNEIIGVHIRRTDNIEAIENSPLDEFEKIIDKEVNINRNKIFLATDSNEVQLYLLNKYKHNIIINEKKIFSRDTGKGMIDAVIDLYALSKCKKIYGSYHSTYTLIAADINNIDVEIVMSNNN